MANNYSDETWPIRRTKFVTLSSEGQGFFHIEKGYFLSEGGVCLWENSVHARKKGLCQLRLRAVCDGALHERVWQRFVHKNKIAQCAAAFLKEAAGVCSEVKNIKKPLD